eukprot:CAMPEP_0115847074 /NCGR_PEP_ID=MMETSP0287-20121206/10191_1 /TAXON_ID=412157 /ORGANISM="Chrysochromulina rotalis, Strain UIO044" /LENGTH=155 /DNA_ID=CAMNT_0003300889 /DNA_START=10 /DNA_END=477 /DNA_ORIENTATION=+
MAQEKSALEKEIEALMAGTASINEGVKDAQKTASRVRRKSRDLEAAFEAMPTVAKWQGIAALLGDDKSDEAILVLFASIDTDSSATIEKGELHQKLMEMAKANDKPVTADVMTAEVDTMFDDAVKNGLIASDEKITAEEFVAMVKNSIDKPVAAS